ncbi:MAG: NAD-dependent epimerase/dehydratase family protein [Spirochaetales bacterium]
MKILVTGGAGGIGSELVIALSQQHAITALVRPASNRKVLPESTTFAVGDLGDQASLASAVAGMDAVVHSGVTFKTTDMQRINVEGTKLLVEVAKEAGCKLFVYVSSMAVYSALPNETRLTEDLELPVAKHLDPYSRTKLQGEKIVLEACRNSQMAYVIVRPTIVLGDRVAAWYTGILELLRVFPVQFIATHIDVMDVGELSRTLAVLVDRPAAYNQIYNLGGFDVPARDYFAMLGEVIGRRTFALPRWLASFAALFVPACLWFMQKNLVLDSSKIRKATGLEPQVDLRAFREGRSRRAFFPTTEAEILQAWRQCYRQFVVNGGSYSYLLKNTRSPQPSINLQRFSRILALADRQVTVEAGAPIYQILDYLDQHNLTLAAVPEFLGASAGGALMTQVHGSSIKHSGVAALANRIKYLEDGETKVAVRGEPGFSELIYNRSRPLIFVEVTFDCVDQYKVERQISWNSDADFEQVLERNFRENLSCTMEWYPDHHEVMTWKINPVESSRRSTGVPFYLHHTPWVLNRFHPAGLLRPAVNKSQKVLGPWTHLGHFGRFSAALATNRNVEFALPMGDMPYFIREVKTLVATEKVPLIQLGFRCGGKDGLPHSLACDTDVVWVELVLGTNYWMPRLQKVLDRVPHTFHTGKFQFR